MTRITGLATGLDVDSLVQETMQAYQTKIDTVDQQKKVVELQQEISIMITLIYLNLTVLYYKKIGQQLLLNLQIQQ